MSATPLQISSINSPSPDSSNRSISCEQLLCAIGQFASYVNDHMLSVRPETSAADKLRRMTRLHRTRADRCSSDHLNRLVSRDPAANAQTYTKFTHTPFQQENRCRMRNAPCGVCGAHAITLAPRGAGRNVGNVDCSSSLRSMRYKVSRVSHASNHFQS